jgi:hypothetical protein
MIIVPVHPPLELRPPADILVMAGTVSCGVLVSDWTLAVEET